MSAATYKRSATTTRSDASSPPLTAAPHKLRPATSHKRATRSPTSCRTEMANADNVKNQTIRLLSTPDTPSLVAQRQHNQGPRTHIQTILTEDDIGVDPGSWTLDRFGP